MLCEKLKKDIDTNEQEKLLTDIEIPLAKVLAKMGFAMITIMWGIIFVLR